MSDDFAVLAARALELVPDGARIGLGSGRTAIAFTRALGERARQGLRVKAVPTSEATGQLARTLGIPLDTLDPAEPLEVTIDGADEVERSTLNLIKGWGAALTRERIVGAASRRQVILVTAEKLVDRLGQRGRLPVEVLPFAAPFCARQIEALAVPGGLKPRLRPRDGGGPLVTDNGNWILDCALGPQADPAGLERALCAIPGVIDCGIFVGTASLVLAAEGGAVRELSRSQRS
jgi:ribose 5-phosphate isomerase A